MVAPSAISEDDVANLIISDDLSGEPTFKAYIEARVYDNKGHLIRHHKQPMRSLTQAFLALFSIAVAGTFQGPSTDLATGVISTVLGLPGQQNSSVAADISWDWSIQLGSGTQTFTPTLTTLAAPIANGSGAGQLTYGSVSVSYSQTSISITAVVSNYSNASIPVSEIGLIATIYIQYRTSVNSQSSYSALLTYDTFSSPIQIPPGGTAAFQITISFSG
jgi:hypothetical protein